MRSKEQDERIKAKVLFLGKLFLTNPNLSDKELSEISGISSTSVGRYLTSEDAREVLGEKTFNFIKEKRKENLYKAKVKGGQTFASNNNAIKDNEGRFIGSYPKR